VRTVGAAARPGWLDAAEVAAANYRLSWISTPSLEHGGRRSQVRNCYASNSHYDSCSQFLNPGSVHRALKLLHQAVRNSEKNPTA